MPSRDEALPLSEAQLGIWLGHHRAEDSTVFHAAECVLLEGALDPRAFHAALDATLAEAAALHTSFVEDAGEPRQVARAHAGLALEHVSIASQELEAHAGRVLRQPLDLEHGPLFRHQLIALGPGRHAWLHVAHHIALDGYGFALVARRVAERYTAALEGAPLRGGFAPFAPVLAEDLAYQRSAQRDEDGAFWRAELAGRRAAELGGTRRAGHALRRRALLEAEALERLRAACSPRRVSWLDVLVAVAALRVGRLSDQRAFVLGLPAMLRLGTSALRTPCMAMNIAPLPVDLAASGSLLELAGALSASLARQRPHQRYRYEHLRLERAALAGRPFGPIVNLMPFDGPLRFGDCAARVLGIAAGPVEDLALSFALRGRELEIVVDGHPELFGAAELEQLAAQLRGDVLDFLDAPERRAPPALRAAPPRPPVEPLWPLDALHARARAQPGAPALVAGERTLDYAALSRAVQGCARWLADAGVRAGDLVALDLPRSLPAVLVVLGALEAGAGYLALDPKQPAARRLSVLERARPRILVSEGGDLGAGLAQLGFAAPDLESWLACALPSPERRPRAAFDAAYVVFTSGSSGEPKGVVVGSSALAHFVASARHAYGFTPADRVLQFAPLSFDASVEELFVSLASGAAVVLRDEHALESPETFLAHCASTGVTVLDLPTAFFHELALAMRERALAPPPAVRLVIIGGEAASAAQVAAFRAAAPAVRLLNTYGPSEATVVATVADLSRWDGRRELPIGAPLPGVEVVLCDAAGRIIGAPDACGELCILGPTLAAGYLGREDLTRERFVTLPGRGRAYRTGDAAALAGDGQLVYRGRLDDELKIAGQRIAPAELEARLSLHPQVRAALAWGESSEGGSVRLVAHVEADAERVDPGALRAFVREALPAAMVPARVVIHARLPRTAHGKLDRVAARRTALSPAPRPGLPASPREEAVLAAWREVLGIEHIGLDDDFFVLGGHSLQVIQLANRLSRSGREVRVALVFQNPTPRQQARLLDGTRGAPPAAHFEPAPVALPESWFRELPRVERCGGERILLTGATGFVGVHLLARWLAQPGTTLVCPVRAPDLESARARLFEQARAAGLALEHCSERLEVVPLDLADAPLERLAARIAPCATLFHCAAQVSLVRSYESLVPANVLATRELLGLAGRWGSAFHYVSSLATLPAGGAREVLPLAAHDGLVDGYQRSKWHAEQLCAAASARGLPVAVYRLGRVVGPRARPAVHAADLLWRIARTASRVGAWPELPHEEHWIPADEASDVMVRLASAGSARAPGSAYHLVHTGRVSLASFRDALVATGCALESVPLAVWMERVRATADDQDRSTLAFFELRAGAAASSVALDVRDEHVRALLPDVEARPIEDEQLAAYCRAARDSGLLAPPR